MKNRRNFSPKEKLEIILEGIAIGNIQEVCRRYGIKDTQYYDWKNRLFKNANKIYAKENKKEKSEIEYLEEQLKKKDEIIAEIATENLQLKKGRWV